MNYGLVVSWKSVVVWASWLCMCPEHRRLCFCIFLLLLMSDCSVEPLNICLDKSQFHFSQDFKSDGRRKKSRYYMSAPCCCWVPFSSLEIKNVHSHKLERRLVLPFYSKDELHIAHEVWNVLIKQCKPLTFMSYYTITKANSHPWELTLTLINVSTLAGGGGGTHTINGS